MLSAELALIGDFEAATTALRDTALDILDDQCGGAEDGDPNNVYGDGRIDAAAAVALVATGGTLAGTVTDLDTRRPDRRGDRDGERRYGRDVPDHDRVGWHVRDVPRRRRRTP